MQQNFRLFNLIKYGKFVSVIIAVTLAFSPLAFATEPPFPIPAWLSAHVGNSNGKIARVVLQRARALYLRKVAEGTIQNPCYLAMDATRPNSLGKGPGRRFYVICEAERSFQAFSSGHGGGRNLKGFANFRNGRRCARHFSNALDSRLTTGGAYVTAEAVTSFKGYYRSSTKKDTAYLRTFIQFDGEGDTANARPRDIGGHPAVLLRAVCRKKNPESPHADEEGYVRFGRLINYAAGRSSGCTTWTASDSRTIISLVKDNPTTLYIYPEARDIAAVASAVSDGKALSDAGLYWNASCLKGIGSPKFWPKKKLEPVIAKYKATYPVQPPQPLRICKN